MTEANPDNRIRELRKRAGLTAKDLAERIGTTEATISRIESGKQSLTQIWLIKIARAVGVRVSELLEGDDEINLTKESVTVIGRIGNDKWNDFVLYDNRNTYAIPLAKLINTQPFKLAAFEYVDEAQGWVIGCELPRLVAEEFNGREFVVCRVNQYKKYELSLKRLEVGHFGHYLVSGKGDPSNRIIKLNDSSITTLWRVLMRYETYFNTPFVK